MKCEIYNDSMQNEEWRDIKEYEGLYQISNFGRVKSFYKNRVLSDYTQNGGYHCINLCKRGKRKPMCIHRLVAIAYIPNPNNLPEVNHKDGNKSNNHVDNLEWVTRSENIVHSFKRLGRKSSNKKIHCVELDLTFDSIVEASTVLGINRGSISHVICGINKTSGGYQWKRK